MGCSPNVSENYYGTGDTHKEWEINVSIRKVDPNPIKFIYTNVSSYLYLSFLPIFRQIFGQK